LIAFYYFKKKKQVKKLPTQKFRKAGTTEAQNSKYKAKYQRFKRLTISLNRAYNCTQFLESLCGLYNFFKKKLIDIYDVIFIA